MTSQLQELLNTLPNMGTDELPSLLGDLEHVKAAATARLWGATPPAVQQAAPDQLLDIKTAAERIGMSVDWLYDNKEKLPFTRRVGGRVRFSAKGIEHYISGKNGLTARRQNG